ncbi:rfbP protein [Vibrio anguillarum]|nr:rfbP protein [Vibrio anguillarum]
MHRHSQWVFIVTPKPPPWAVVIEPWGYCPKKCPC